MSNGKGTMLSDDNQVEQCAGAQIQTEAALSTSSIRSDNQRRQAAPSAPTDSCALAGVTRFSMNPGYRGGP